MEKESGMDEMMDMIFLQILSYTPPCREIRVRIQSLSGKMAAIWIPSYFSSTILIDLEYSGVTRREM